MELWLEGGKGNGRRYEVCNVLVWAVVRFWRRKMVVILESQWDFDWDLWSLGEVDGGRWFCSGGCGGEGDVGGEKRFMVVVRFLHYLWWCRKIGRKVGWMCVLLKEKNWKFESKKTQLCFFPFFSYVESRNESGYRFYFETKKGGVSHMVFSFCLVFPCPLFCFFINERGMVTFGWWRSPSMHHVREKQIGEGHLLLLCICGWLNPNTSYPHLTSQQNRVSTPSEESRGHISNGKGEMILFFFFNKFKLISTTSKFN